MNKLSKIIFAFIAIFVIYSCTDLEEDLIGDVTTSFTIPGVNTTGGGGGGGILSGAYAELRGAGTANHGGYYSVQEITTDEMVISAKGGDWYDGGILIELHQHTYSPVHGFVNGTWAQTYGAINTVNELLAGGELDTNQESQARALRAYFYLRLLDLYRNVKLIVSPGEDVPQSTSQEVFDFIEGELLGALGIGAVSSSMDLSTSPLGTDLNAYQINQHGALGILSKLYLNGEAYVGVDHYQEAADAAAYIIDSGLYRLCDDGCTVPNLGKRTGVASDPDNLEGFAAVFAPNNENNPEHIFSVFYDEASGGGMNFAMMNLHYSSQFTWNFSDQPWNGYATLEEFYNSFDDGDARKTASFIAGEQLDFGGSAILDYASDDGNLVLNYTPNNDELQPNSLREAGARPGKFSFKQFGRADMDNDYPIIRLGEIYLIRAEALARVSGNWSDALPDVNVIRGRAKASVMGSIDADGFLAERGREMFQEGARRTDLIRFGRYNDSWWEKPTDPSDHVNVFPIPFDQIQASNGSLSQNPGY
jgi:hypothetical protein